MDVARADLHGHVFEVEGLGELEGRDLRGQQEEQEELEHSWVSRCCLHDIYMGVRY